MPVGTCKTCRFQTQLQLPAWHWLWLYIFWAGIRSVLTLSTALRLTQHLCALLTQDCINEDTEQRPSMKQIVERLQAAEGLSAAASVEDKIQQVHIPAAMFDSANSL